MESKKFMFSSLTAKRQLCCTSGLVSHRTFCYYQPIDRKLFPDMFAKIWPLVFFNTFFIIIIVGIVCHLYCEGVELRRVTLDSEGSGSDAGEQQRHSTLSCPVRAAAPVLCLDRGGGGTSEALWQCLLSLQDPVCQQPRVAGRKCISGRCPNSLPQRPRFAPSLPSWRVFLFCLRALRTQRPFKTAGGKNEYGAVVIEAGAVPLLRLAFFVLIRQDGTVEQLLV